MKRIMLLSLILVWVMPINALSGSQDESQVLTSLALEHLGDVLQLGVREPIAGQGEVDTEDVSEIVDHPRGPRPGWKFRGDIEDLPA